jgi:hypothetical protein
LENYSEEDVGTAPSVDKDNDLEEGVGTAPSIDMKNDSSLGSTDLSNNTSTPIGKGVQQGDFKGK